MNKSKLLADLRRDEGLRLTPYKDTVGVLTIGYGRNLDYVGISEAEADVMLENDLRRTITDCDRLFPWWRDMPEPAKRALANMCFNLGAGRLSSFKVMLAALKRGDYSGAATAALDSKWAKQVGQRANRVAELYKQAAVSAS